MATATRTAAMTSAPIRENSTGWLTPRADHHGGAVRGDLGQGLTDLRRVEAHPHDGVGTHDTGVLDQPVHGVASAVLEQLGVLAHLTTDQRLERRPDAAYRAHRPHDEAEARAERSLDLVLGELECSGDGKGAV